MSAAASLMSPNLVLYATLQIHGDGVALCEGGGGLPLLLHGINISEEVLISPQARFTVSSEPYEGADGFTYIDMVENAGTLFVS